MRLASAVLVASAIAVTAPGMVELLSRPTVAQAQSNDGKFRIAEAKKKAEAKKPEGKKGNPKDGGTSGSYANMPLAVNELRVVAIAEVRCPSRALRRRTSATAGAADRGLDQ